MPTETTETRAADSLDSDAERPVLVTVDSVDAVEAEEWNSLASGRSVYVTHEWAAVTERSPSTTATYILARTAAGRLVGALPAFYSDGRGNPRYDPFASIAEPLLGTSAVRADWSPALVAGCRSGYSAELLIDRSLPERTQRAVGNRLLRRLRELADALGVRAVALPYLNERGVEQRRALEPGSTLVLTQPDCRLAVPWRSWEERLAHAPSRLRAQIRRDFRAFDRQGYRVSDHRLSEVVGEAAGLLAQRERKYASSMTKADAEAYLTAIAKRMDERTIVSTCRRGSRLVAFALSLEWDGALYARVSGFDYATAGTNSEYFVLSLHRRVLHTIERNLSAVHLGPESYDAKVRRGAVLCPLVHSIELHPMGRGWERAVEAWNGRQSRRWRLPPP